MTFFISNVMMENMITGPLQFDGVISCQVIIKLCDQVNAWMAEQPASSSGRSNSQTFRQYQQEIENLKVK